MQEWETPELKHLKQRLIHDPFSLALLAAALPEEDEDSPEEEPTGEVFDERDEEMELDLAKWQEELETQAISSLDGVMARVPVEALAGDQWRYELGREHK